MEIFRNLAQSVESQWSLKSFDVDCFPEIATQALLDFAYDFSLEKFNKQLATWLLETVPLPSQINLYNVFGQPPVTLFNNDKFVVDLYLWCNFDTSIHGHGFRGAFRVLHGSSFHEEFSVKTLKEYSNDLALTDLGVPEMSLLHAGDVRTILPGKELTHRVVHLENPTVTLCVKTINEPKLSQWNYFPNGLAVKKGQLPASIIKSVFYFEYLVARNYESGMAFLNSLLEKVNLSTQLNLLEELIGGGLGLVETTTEILLNEIYGRHSEEEWFSHFELLGELALNELHFDHYDSPNERLLAHCINCGYGMKAALRFLETLNKRSFSTIEMQNLIQSLADDERLYGTQSKQVGQLKKFDAFK